MILPHTPPESEKDRIVKFWRLDVSFYHKTVQEFTVRNWWNPPISFLKIISFGLLFLIGVAGSLASFPWDDSTVPQRLAIILTVSPHMLFIIWIFIAAIATWIDPYKLKFDDKGQLILQSVLRRQCVVIRNIKSVLLAKQNEGERGDDVLGIRVKFSGGKLRLCRFSERDEFLKALKAANPAIIVEFV